MQELAGNLCPWASFVVAVLGSLRMDSADNTNEGKAETKSRESIDATLNEKTLSLQGAVMDELVKDEGNEILRKSSKEVTEVLPTVLLLENKDASVPVAVTSPSQGTSEERRIEVNFEGDHTLDAPSSSTDPNGKDEGQLDSTNLNAGLAIQELLPDGPRYVSYMHIPRLILDKRNLYAILKSPGVS